VFCHIASSLVADAARSLEELKLPYLHYDFVKQLILYVLLSSGAVFPSLPISFSLTFFSVVCRAAMDHTNNEREMASHAIGVLTGEEGKALLSHEQVSKAFLILLQVCDPSCCDSSVCWLLILRLLSLS
jgi:hypothetical protein